MEFDSHTLNYFLEIFLKMIQSQEILYLCGSELGVVAEIKKNFIQFCDLLFFPVGPYPIELESWTLLVLVPGSVWGLIWAKPYVLSCGLCRAGIECAWHVLYLLNYSLVLELLKKCKNHRF